MPEESAEDGQAIEQRGVEVARERAEERDDAPVLSDVMDELAWCEKEVRYLVGGSEHPTGEKRLGRIRQRVAEIDAMLAVIEGRAGGEADA